jgi:tetratricopeptide (TPR) repeat protein
MTDAMLQTAATVEQKANAYVRKAEYYFQHACCLETKCNHNYLALFRKSYTNYIIANTLDPRNTSALLGQAKCLIKLGLNRKALGYLESLSKSRAFNESGEFWLLYALVNRKCAKIWNGESRVGRKAENIDKAKRCLEKAISLNQTGASNEMRILDNLIDMRTEYNANIHNYTSHLKENKSSYKLSTTRSYSEKEVFRIASIDGGGLKGRFNHATLHVRPCCHR